MFQSTSKLSKRTAKTFELLSSQVDAIWYERTEASNERIDKIFTLALATTERREMREKSIPMLRSYFNVNRQHVWYANSRTFKCSAYRSASYRTPLRANGGKRRKLYGNTLLLFSSRKLPPIKPAYAKHFRWGIISFYRTLFTIARDRYSEREREGGGERKGEIEIAITQQLRQCRWIVMEK